MFSRVLERHRVQGHANAKIYFDAPVTIRAAHLNAIANILRSGGSGRLRIYVNGDEVLFPEGPAWIPKAIDIVQEPRTYEEVRTVALANDRVRVYFARAASASSSTADPQSLGALWAVRKVLESARWRFGTFLFRTWGAAVAVTVAFLVALYGFEVEPVSARDVAATSLLLALGLYLVITLGIGLGRRVRLDLRRQDERRRVGLDAAIQALVIPVGGLLVNALWPLITAWWRALIEALSY